MRMNYYLAKFSLPSSSLLLKLPNDSGQPVTTPVSNPVTPVTVLRLGSSLSSFLRLQNGDQLVSENCPIWGFNYSSKLVYRF